MQASYQVYSQDHEDEEPIIYCEGQLSYEEEPLEESKLDLKSIQSRCTQIIEKEKYTRN